VARGHRPGGNFGIGLLIVEEDVRPEHLKYLRFIQASTHRLIWGHHSGPWSGILRRILALIVGGISAAL
jgi:hypothetical protein